MNPTFRTASKFILVGFAATAVHVLVALTCYEIFEISAFTANFVAFFCAVLFSYSGHYRWTFLSRGNHQIQLPKFAVVAVLGLLLNQSIVYVMVDEFGFPYRSVLLLIIIVVPLLSYTLSDKWVFN